MGIRHALELFKKYCGGDPPWSFMKMPNAKTDGKPCKILFTHTKYEQQKIYTRVKMVYV